MTPTMPSPETNPFLSRDECKAIFDRIVALAKPGSHLHVYIDSVWTASTQWARSRAFLTRDVHDIYVRIGRNQRPGWGGQSGGVMISRFDDASLRDAIAQVNDLYEYNTQDVVNDTRNQARPPEPHLKPTLWSDATAHFDGEQRGTVVRSMIAPAEAAGLLAAGELNIKAGVRSMFNTLGWERYYPTTRVEVSTTVRDPKGTGSGWAGTDDFDVTRIDMQALAQRALEKCQRSVNPVALEPGRYTAILEPQAVADLWSVLMSRGQYETDDSLNRLLAEGKKRAIDHDVPFGSGEYNSKIGERVLDARLSLRADPMDPEGGFLPFEGLQGDPYHLVRWIDEGVLRQLEYTRLYGLQALGLETEMRNSRSWRIGVTGETTSIDEMIATTKRGVLVTRFHDVTLFHRRSFSCTGYTRDGLWFIENGKISKPVKNFRFTESPLFVFNKVEQVGPVKRVFASGEPLRRDDYAWIAPSLKVTDFNFTQLADAV